MPKIYQFADIVLDAVSEELEIAKESILSKSRHAEIVDARHMAKMIKDIIDDPDCQGGAVFRKWLAVCDEKDTLIDWDELL